MPLPERFVSDMLRVDTMKFLADGGLSGATAALSVHYRHAEPEGRAALSIADELLGLCAEIARRRLADRDARDRRRRHRPGARHLRALGPHPRGLAHRIEHFGLPDATQLARAAKLGIIAAPQTIFIHSLGRNFRNYLPDSFLPRTYPVRAMLDAGVRVALSSDAPVVEDDNPLVGMMAAITRRDERRATRSRRNRRSIVSEALYGYTMGGAVASGDEAQPRQHRSGQVGGSRRPVRRSADGAGRGACRHRAST